MYGGRQLTSSSAVCSVTRTGTTAARSWNASYELNRLLDPYYSANGVTLYHGDAREVLPQLLATGVKADLLLTDPPYGISYISNQATAWDPLQRKMVQQPSDAIPGDDDLTLLACVASLCHALLANDRHAFLFASPMLVGETKQAISPPFTVTSVMCWDKELHTGGDLDGGFAPGWEAILHAPKRSRDGTLRPIKRPRPRNVVRYQWSSRDDPWGHPTAKPVPLLQWLIEKTTLPSELVLDPFAGCGSTLAAARDLHRRAIGIELQEKYAHAAAVRLSQTVLPLDELTSKLDAG